MRQPSGNDGRLVISTNWSAFRARRKIAMLRLLSLISGVFGACLIGSVPAKCEIVRGNLPGNYAGLTASFDSTAAYSLGVKVGATPAEIDSVDLRRRAKNALGGNALLELRNDAAGNPATSWCVSLNSVSVRSTSFAQYVIAPSAAISLDAITIYWLTLTTDTSSPTGLFMASNGPSQSPTSPRAAVVGLRT